MNEYELGLREAGDDELETIIESAEKHLPHSYTIHNLLIIGFRRRLVDRSYSLIYLPVSKNIPFFIIITGVTRKEGYNLTPYWDPNEISLENAKTLLKSIPNWDWEKPVIFNQASLRTLQAADQILLGKDGLSNDKLYLLPEDGYSYKLSSENINYEISDKDIIISRLNESYAPLVMKHWIYRNDTEEGVRSYMKALPAMAAFVKVAPNENNENQCQILLNGKDIIDESYKPVCWVICRFYGEIGFTFTLPEYRNKGLCKAVNLALIKELTEMGITPYVNITNSASPASIKSHEKIGFQKYSPVGYHVFLKKGMKYEDY